MAVLFSCPYAELKLNSQCSLWVAQESGPFENPLLFLPQDEARTNGEEQFQLLEGCTYEYEVPPGYQIKEIRGILWPSKRDKRRGRISPGNYVGRLPLSIIDNDNNEIFTAIEIRSAKADYRSEYRKMLEDITRECTDLLMIHSSPVTQRYSVDYTGDSETLYQRFSFVKSLVDSNEFHNAVQRVISMPVTVWTSEREEVDVRRIKRIRPYHIRQLASRSSRVPLPESHYLRSRVETVPQKISTQVKIDTSDTPENRFIKYVLREFERFCGVVVRTIKEKQNGTYPHIYYEAQSMENRLSEYLSHSVFREISQPRTLPLNSPILQRKEGYREIFRVWLMYDLAAKLSWDALDADTYQAGKRDVATLYEYWLFFKLLRLVEEIFQIPRTETEKLIKETGDGLGLQLKAGKHTPIEGEYTHKKRTIKIKYSYNRTFGLSVYPKSGSWSQQMRPDYTLSFWPKKFTEEEAERQELIVHIHFDAKYKVDDLQYIFATQGDPDSDLDDEKESEKKGKYKRADLLKMHAYKDAIRRTAGAYVLYPGTEHVRKEGFHEVVPGLGAFPVSPSNNGEGLECVKAFILEVIEHFSNRASQWETAAWHNYRIMKHPSEDKLQESVPEYTAEKERTAPPHEVYVLAGFVQEKQKDWILQHGLYNIRLDREITPELAGAAYLLLYDKIGDYRTASPWLKGLFKIKKYPRIKSAEWLVDKGYPDPSQPEYFIYEIAPELEEWSRENLGVITIPDNVEVKRPFTLSLMEVMR